MKKAIVTFFAAVLCSAGALAAAGPAHHEMTAYEQAPSLSQELYEIEQMYYRGELTLEEAELLTQQAYGLGAGFYVEINGVTYKISFAQAWQCAKTVGKTAGCLIATRSISCVSPDVVARIVSSCRLERAN